MRFRHFAPVVHSRSQQMTARIVVAYVTGRRP
jgi:hypothetical protein